MLCVEAVHITRQLPLGGEMIPVLKDMSFEIASGEWIALMGPSGSGKSTLLGLLAGIDQPSSGTLVIEGQEITQMREQPLARLRNQKIGIVFQSFNLIPTLTAQENVEVPLYITDRRCDASRLAKEMLEMVGLTDRLKHRPHQLSGGQQQRVAIARALVTQPKILLADEPTGNLDSVNGEQILHLFQNLQQRLGLTVIIATHDQAVAACADRVLRLHDGQLVTSHGSEQ
jgi:putative ABC transport system ATP-binding protein